MTGDTTDAGVRSLPVSGVRTVGSAVLWRAAVPVAVVALAAPVVIWGYRYHVGLDGVAYLSLARQYAQGNLAEAVNGYWSPLLSWLAAPAIAVGLPPIVAGHLVLVGAAALAVAGVRRVARLVADSPPAADVAALAAVPFALAAVTYGVFADLLVAALLLQVVGALLSPRFTHAWTGGAEAGAWGAAAYLAKVVALPVVVIAVVLAVVLRWGEAGPRRTVLRNAAVALALLAVTAAAWSAALTWRYGELTVSTSVGYNAAVVAPGSRGNPIHYAGLLPPPTRSGVSAWDDPTLLQVDAPGWSQTVSVSGARRITGNVGRSSATAVRTLLDDAPVLTLAILGGALLAMAHRSARRPALVVLGVAGAYTAAHVLTWLEPRYLWPPILLGTALVAVLVRRIEGRTQLVAAALLLLAVAAPLVDGAVLRWNAGEETRAVARLLAAHDVEGRNVASANNFQRGSILCLHAGCRYYGTAARDGTPLDEQLAEHDIDVYLVELPVAGDTPVPGHLEPAARYGDTLVYEIPAAR